MSTLDKEQLYKYLLASKMFQRWHWFRWHFEHKIRGANPNAFAEEILEACLDCEKFIPGFSVKILDSIAELSGQEKYEPHYEQLMQLLSELLVIRQIVSSFGGKLRIESEASLGRFGKVPELILDAGDKQVAIEVKCPALLAHQRARDVTATEIAGRFAPKETLQKALGEFADKSLGPADNRVKDFLISADSKFLAAKSEFKDLHGLLVIIWDDFIYEPITSLVHKNCGLFTDQTFARDRDGKPLRFENVDGVVVIRHLHQFKRGAAGHPTIDGIRSALDYGRDREFPPKAFITNPFGRGMSESVITCLQAYTPEPSMGAEYMPQEFIMWSGGKKT